MASFDCLGNLKYPINSQTRQPRRVLGFDAYCFFKISIRPAFVRSLPSTARLKSSITSGATVRFEGLEGLVEWIAGMSVAVFKPPRVEVGYGIERFA